MIGVFDSGVGGLGIMAELKRLSPASDLLYLGDAAWAPYGPRPLEEVRARSQTVADHLAEAGCGTIVIACNTASAAALHHLRATRPQFDFVGMEPALKPASLRAPGGRVGIVATEATFQSEIFASVMERFGADVAVSTVAAPVWVELVESGELTGSRAESEVAARLDELGEVDVIVLACTHFPALSPLIEGIAGEGVEVIDPAPAVAAQGIRVAGSNGSLAGSGMTSVWSTGSLAAIRRVTAGLGLAAEIGVIGLR